MDANAVDETKELAMYVRGMADATQNPKLSKAADWLERVSDDVCAGGFFGCEGGRDCTSDHK